MSVSLALEAAPKALVYAALMLCVGAAAGRGLLRFRIAHLLTPQQGFSVEEALRRVAVRASLVLLAALVCRAWAHTAAAFGVADSFTYQSLHLIAIESDWGSSWQWQMAGALGLTAVSCSIARWPSGGWLAESGASVALCYLLPLLGHAAGEPARMLLHGSHILGAGIWLGTLAASSIASYDPEHTHAFAPFGVSAARLEILSHFSPVAFTGAGLLVATGAIAVWWYLGELSNLWTTDYGRLLFVKLLLAAGAAASGFVNWQTLRRRVTARESPHGRRLLVAAEVALAAGVVLVTALLTETEHP